MPDIEQRRYYSFQFIDMYTHNFAYGGSRATGNGAGSYLLAGPGWDRQKPAGVKDVIRSETPRHRPSTSSSRSVSMRSARR
jgi:hypothetical protein